MASLAFDGNMTIDSTSTLVATGNGTGVYSFSGDVANAGTITTVDDAGGDVVIIGGNYSGNGGQMLFDVALDDDQDGYGHRLWRHIGHDKYRRQQCRWHGCADQ